MSDKNPLEVTPIEEAIAKARFEGDSLRARNLEADNVRLRTLESVYNGEIRLRKFGITPKLSDEKFKELEDFIVNSSGTHEDVKAKAAQRIAISQATGRQFGAHNENDLGVPAVLPPREDKPVAPDVAPVAAKPLTEQERLDKDYEDKKDFYYNGLGYDDDRRPLAEKEYRIASIKQDHYDDDLIVKDNYGNDIPWSQDWRMRDEDSVFVNAGWKPTLPPAFIDEKAIEREKVIRADFLRENFPQAINSDDTLDPVKFKELTDPAFFQETMDILNKGGATTTHQVAPKPTPKKAPWYVPEESNNPVGGFWDTLDFFSAMAGGAATEGGQIKARKEAAKQASELAPVREVERALANTGGATLQYRGQQAQAGQQDGVGPDLGAMDVGEGAFATGAAQPARGAPPNVSIAMDNEKNLVLRNSDTPSATLVQYWNADNNTLPKPANLDSLTPEQAYTQFTAVVRQPVTGEYFYNENIRPFGLQKLDLDSDFAKAAASASNVTIMMNRENRLTPNTRGNLVMPMLVTRWGETGIDFDKIHYNMVWNKLETALIDARSKGIVINDDVRASMLDKARADTDTEIAYVMNDNKNAMFVSSDLERDKQTYLAMGPVVGPIMAMVSPWSTAGSWQVSKGKRYHGQTVEDLNENVIWGLSNTGPFTLIGSWALDRDMSWTDIGGEKQIEKLMEGYNLGEDLDKFTWAGRRILAPAIGMVNILGMLTPKGTENIVDVDEEHSHSWGNMPGNILGIAAFMAIAGREPDSASLGALGFGAVASNVVKPAARLVGITPLLEEAAIATRFRIGDKATGAARLVDNLLANLGSRNEAGEFIQNPNFDPGTVGAVIDSIKKYDLDTGLMAEDLYGMHARANTSVAGAVVSRVATEVPKKEIQLAEIEQKLAELAEAAKNKSPDVRDRLLEISKLYEEARAAHDITQEAVSATLDTHGKYIEPLAQELFGTGATVEASKKLSQSPGTAAQVVELYAQFRNLKAKVLAIPRIKEIYETSPKVLAEINDLHRDIDLLRVARVQSKAAEKALLYSKEELAAANKALGTLKLGSEEHAKLTEEMLSRYKNAAEQKAIWAASGKSLDEKRKALEKAIAELGLDEKQAAYFLNKSKQLYKVQKDLSTTRQIAGKQYGFVLTADGFTTIWNASDDITKFFKYHIPNLEKYTAALENISTKLRQARGVHLGVEEQAAFDLELERLANSNILAHGDLAQQATKLKEEIALLKSHPEKLHQSLELLAESLKKIGAVLKGKDFDVRANILITDWKSSNRIVANDSIKYLGDRIRLRRAKLADLIGLVPGSLGLIDPKIAKNLAELNNWFRGFTQEIGLARRYDETDTAFFDYMTTRNHISMGPKGNTSLNSVLEEGTLAGNGIRYLAKLIDATKDATGQVPLIDKYIESIARAYNPNTMKVAHATDTVELLVKKLITELAAQLEAKTITDSEALLTLTTKIKSYVAGTLHETEVNEGFAKAITYQSIAYAAFTAEKLKQLDKLIWEAAILDKRLRPAQIEAINAYMKGGHIESMKALDPIMSEIRKYAKGEGGSTLDATLEAERKAIAKIDKLLDGAKKLTDNEVENLEYAKLRLKMSLTDNEELKAKLEKRILNRPENVEYPATEEVTIKLLDKSITDIKNELADVEYSLKNAGGLPEEELVTLQIKKKAAEAKLRDLKYGMDALNPDTPENLIYSIVDKFGMGQLKLQTHPEAGARAADQVRKAVIQMTSVPLLSGETYLPKHVMDSFNSANDVMIKSLSIIEPSAPYDPKRPIAQVTKLWAHNILMGTYPVPNPRYWFKNYDQDIGQMFITEGFGTAARVAFSEVPGLIPYSAHINNFLRTANEKYLPRFLGVALNTHVTDVFGSVDRVVPGSTLTYAQVNQICREQGLFDTMISESVAEMERIIGRKHYGTNVLGTKWQPGQDAMHEHLVYMQQRTRIAMFMDLHINKGVPAIEAANRVKAALYDWESPLTYWEANYVGNMASFYRYFRESGKQAANVMLAPYKAIGIMDKEGPLSGKLAQIYNSTAAYRRARAYSMLDRNLSTINLSSRDTILDEDQERGVLAANMNRGLTNNTVLPPTKMDPEFAAQLLKDDGTYAQYWANEMPNNTVIDNMEFHSINAKMFIAVGVTLANHATNAAGYGKLAQPSDYVFEEGIRAWTGRMLPLYKAMADSIASSRGTKNWTTDTVPVRGGERVMVEAFNGMNSSKWIIPDYLFPDGPLHYSTNKHGGSDLRVNPMYLTVLRMTPVISQLPAYITPMVQNPEKETIPQALWWARNMSGLLISKPYDPETEYKYSGPERRTEALRALGTKAEEDLAAAQQKNRK